MSHKQMLWLGGKIRYSIDKDKMRLCIVYHCPNFSFGSCGVPKCTLRKEAIAMRENPTAGIPKMGQPRWKRVNRTDHPNYCIFEQKICRYARRENGGFMCKAPSDEEMKCR